jgi:hypothetical protein
MSTYLQGVTDTGFNSVNFSPNLPYLMNALQKVTARYEKNYDEMSQGYSSILNAEMYNDKQSGKRDQYLNEIKDKLKAVSTTDLSVQSNIDSANSLYTPFWEDKTMLSHIADTRARKNQLIEQEKIKKEHPDYDSSTPTAVMNYYINKIKTAEDPNIINQTPLINAVGLKNNPKEFQEWLKKNDYKKEFSAAQNGYIYKQVNGADTTASYNELYTMYLGDTAQDQYNMYGEYYKIQAIQNIQNENKKNGIILSDDEAIKKIPDFYIKEQLQNFDYQKEALIADFDATFLNSKKNEEKGNDIALEKDVTRMKDIKEKLSEIDKKYNLFKNKGGTNEQDLRDYNKLISDITSSPTNFFAKMTFDKDANTAAKMAASNQSLSITVDESALRIAKMEQEASQFLQTNALGWATLNARIEENANKESKGSSGEKNATGNAYENVTPSVNNSPASNSIVGIVTEFQDEMKKETSEGINNILSTIQSSNSNLFSNVISPQELAVIAKGYQSNEYSQEYKTIFKKAKDNLINQGVSKEIVNAIKTPEGVILALDTYFENQMLSNIEKKNENIKNNTVDPVLNETIRQNQRDYYKLQDARKKINNAYASQKLFNDNINKRIQDNPLLYEKVSIKKKDGTIGLITPQDLVDQYPLDKIEIGGKKTRIKIPYGIMQQYINGTLNEKKEELFHEKEDDPRGPRISLGYKYTFLDPETNINYNLTEIVKKYGTSKELNERLNKTVLANKSSIPGPLQKTFNERTGKQGRVITYNSLPDKENDLADKYANSFLQNIDANVIREKDKYVIVNGTNDMKELLNEEAVNTMISNPMKGLTSMKFYPIGMGDDPSKRNVELVYDISKLLGSDQKTREKYKNWDGRVVFKIRSDANIEGFPNGSTGAFYDLLLDSDSQGIKNTEIDEKFGLKYEFYKDQNNQIQYRAGYKTIIETVDSKGAKVLSSVWKNYDGNGLYTDSRGFVPLPSNTTVDDLIDTLRSGKLTVSIQDDIKTEEYYKQTTQPNLAKQTRIAELTKERNNLKINK